MVRLISKSAVPLRTPSVHTHAKKRTMPALPSNRPCVRPLCVPSYMSIVESLPTYGVHYYAVKVSELLVKVAKPALKKKKISF